MFSCYIFDTFRVSGERVRFGIIAGRCRPAPPTVGRTLVVVTKEQALQLQLFISLSSGSQDGFRERDCSCKCRRRKRCF